MIPGLGSVIGGRRVGYLQMLVCFSGQVISLIFGVRFIFWTLANWKKVYNPNADDPLAAFRDMWPHMRWPLLGILLFGVAWLWALFTSYRLLDEAKTSGGGNGIQSP